MGLSALCIRRPVFATVLSLIIVLLGLAAYQRLTVREYPNIDPPVVTVRTSYPGASAEIVESQVTQVLEDSLAGIEGIDYISSTSREETSFVSIHFTLDRDPDVAASDVRDRASRVRDQLPDEINEPIIQKAEADAEPIIYLSFSSDRHTPLELTDYADRYVKNQIQTLPGVADVQIFGERRYAMRIWLDPLRLAAYDLTPQDVEDALRAQNVEVPAGVIESRSREFSVVSETDLTTPAQFDDIVLKRVGGYLVRLSDVGRAELGAEDDRTFSRVNGRTSVAMGVVKQATANPLDVSRALRDRLPALTDNLPEGMHVEIAYDKSVFIAESIDNVKATIGEAIVLVVLIIFFFLRSVRATLIPLVTIPVSLIGAFAMMFFLGFSINTLTLLALVLAIGLVVDDAIVVLENIFRHVEAGMTPLQAAYKGSGEIAMAVVAMTLTLAAVYTPIAFMTGTTGRLFTEFALTLAGTVLVSGFVALTVSPMMCSKLLHHEKKHHFLYNLIERGLMALTAGYRRLLLAALRVRPLVLLIGLCVAGSSWFLFNNLDSELAPYEDQGTIIGVFNGPTGATSEYTDRYARQLEQIYAEVPEAERYFVVAGFRVASRGISFIKLVPWEQRERSQQDIVNELRGKMGNVPGVLAFAVNPAPLGQSGSSTPVRFIVQTSRPYSELQTMVDRMLERARQNPGLVNVDTDLKLDKPQLNVEIDRNKVADMGVGVSTLGRTLETLIGGRQVTRFERDGEQYDVIVQVADPDRATPDDLRRIYVRGANGQMVQLSNLVSITETVAPQELDHFNQLRSATIEANLAPGYSLGEALTFLDQVADEVLPGEAQTDYSGLSREFKEASAGLYLTFVLALGFIFLVLSAQFESFRSPFIIMLTVPLSITGGLLALFLSGGTLNIYSQVGLVTLIGLITKHGILIVQFANQLREEGRALMDAVVEAAVLRLRPILMTTGAMVLGAVPLAIATGAGAQSRQDIGWVIVGGLLVGTFFTLFVIPAVYTYLSWREAAVPKVTPVEDKVRDETLQAAE
ncbi:MAG TPA: efflux RND transporter permease subunit [Geminicoccaceae bacterium]|nr:efflux RND transporter permease subunit [Geminicoccaceae bacterium]